MRTLRFTVHAQQRMAQRNVDEAAVYAAVARPVGTPVAGSAGKFWVYGYAANGRILKVLLSPDKETVITVAWPDE